MNPERIPYGRDASQFFELWHPKCQVAGLAVFIHGEFWWERCDLSLIVHGTNDEDVPIDITRALLWTRRSDPEPPAGLAVIDFLNRLTGA